ncbi:GNAT family N-acetyltransferase [Leekyejoonella antrihumi]|uniref:GNAT family N-acetyltransferase n=1 Tax=Leekyejoonella antrihumi TaxID=1660198 RepID=UPI001FEB2E06|nr:GNAT family N-acetyltransferase [Leekyejoonella antrihumi]
MREPEAGDRSRLIDWASAEVNQYTGGARPRDELEAAMPVEPRRRPGLFVVERDGAMLGFVTIDRRDRDRLGHVLPGGNEAELGYMFLPEAWGHGVATEAAAGALRWFDYAHGGELVVVSAQLANTASIRVADKLGFVETVRFEDYGALQWLGVRRPPNP